MEVESFKVTIVIPTWRRACWLDRCLAAAVAQTRRPDAIIVVGRAEDVAAREVTDRWARASVFPVSWLEVDRPGHVPPVRRGLAAVAGDIVAFLDDDTEPDRVWLAALLEPFSDPLVGCVGGRVITPGFRGKVKRDAGKVRWYGQYVGNLGALETPGPIDVDGVMECNWAWRTELLRCMAFDPVLEFHDSVMYGLDLCLQAKAEGYKIVYNPSARVSHYAAPRDASIDRHDRPRRVQSYSRNYTYIALKHFRWPRLAVFWFWWWLIGERGSYGLATAILDLVGRQNSMFPLIAASLRGKHHGVAEWWRAHMNYAGEAQR